MMMIVISDNDDDEYLGKSFCEDICRSDSDCPRGEKCAEGPKINDPMKEVKICITEEGDDGGEREYDVFNILSRNSSRNVYGKIISYSGSDYLSQSTYGED